MKPKPKLGQPAVERLSPRQKRAVEAYVGPAKGVKKKALELAGYPPSVAATKQGREWTGDMQAAVRELMDREGITDAMLVRKHKTLLNAKSHVFTRDGDEHLVPDNDCQARMVQLGYQVKGMLKPEVNIELVADGIVREFVEVIEKYVPPEKRAEIYGRLGERFAGGAGGSDAGTGRGGPAGEATPAQ